MEKINPREVKGKQIALRHDLIRVRDDYYKVHSQTTKREYDVIKTNDVWHCNCPITDLEKLVVNIFTQ